MKPIPDALKEPLAVRRAARTNFKSPKSKVPYADLRWYFAVKTEEARETIARMRGA